MGLSLAMNSAGKVAASNARKIHNDQKPRRLAQKFCSRRRVIGDSREDRLLLLVVFSCAILIIAAFEIDARINHGVGQVADQVHHQAKQGEDKECAEHQRVIAINCSFESE